MNSIRNTIFSRSINSIDLDRDPLDEWIYFLKNEEIREGFHARGLDKVKEVPDIMHLGEEERLSYEWHIEELHYQASLYRSSFVDGHMEGRKGHGGRHG